MLDFDPQLVETGRGILFLLYPKVIDRVRRAGVCSIVRGQGILRWGRLRRFCVRYKFVEVAPTWLAAIRTILLRSTCFPFRRAAVDKGGRAQVRDRALERNGLNRTERIE